MHNVPSRKDSKGRCVDSSDDRAILQMHTLDTIHDTVQTSLSTPHHMSCRYDMRRPIRTSFLLSLLSRVHHAHYILYNVLMQTIISGCSLCICPRDLETFGFESSFVDIMGALINIGDWLLGLSARWFRFICLCLHYFDVCVFISFARFLEIRGNRLAKNGLRTLLFPPYSASGLLQIAGDLVADP